MSKDLGVYYFHQGTNYYAYQLLGSCYSDEETIVRVWAPNAKKVSVVGDFNKWDNKWDKADKIKENVKKDYERTGPGNAKIEFKNIKEMVDDIMLKNEKK